MTPSGRTTTRPSGFLSSDAIFATSLFGATPTEQVSAVSARTRRLISAAIESAGPKAAMLAVTSRNASSSDRPSMSGVNAENTVKICRDTDW